MGDRALVPPKVFKSISVYAICLSAFFTRCSLLIYTYYIPSKCLAAAGLAGNFRSTRLRAFLGSFAPATGTDSLPSAVYYQAVRHHNATKSGIDILAFMLAVVISVVAAGRIVSITGRYWYFLVLGPIPGAIGAGLMYTVTPTTANAKIIGYQSAFARSLPHHRSVKLIRMSPARSSLGSRYRDDDAGASELS